MSCCHGPEREGAGASATTSATGAGAATAPDNVATAAGTPATRERDIEQVPLPGGKFLMGDAFDEGYPEDGEGPVHEVALSPFTMDATAVTNAEFHRFVAATGYRTESEVYGYSAVFHLLVAADAADVLGRPEGLQWWVTVRGADWAASARAEILVAGRSGPPGRPGIVERRRGLLPVGRPGAADRGAVGVRRPRRAGAGALPLGRRVASRTGRTAATSGRAIFPTDNTLDDGFLGTAPVRTFPPNGYGLLRNQRQRVGVVRGLVPARSTTASPRWTTRRPHASGRAG